MVPSTQNQFNNIYLLYAVLVLILLNAKMNKMGKRDWPPWHLHSNDEGEREDVYLNLNNNLYLEEDV